MPDLRFNGLHYGIANGKLLHVSEVPRGRSCGCMCPSCGANLVAKQGRIREHHFAHSTGEPCRHAGETALHLAAKDTLEKKRELVLPAVELRFDGGRVLPIASESRYQIESVSVEQRVAGIVPDIVARIGGRRLYVEIRVTHGVDDRKLGKIKRMGISAVEIDLSSAPRDYPPEELEKLVVEGGAHKKWLYNAVADRRRKQIIREATVRPFVWRCNGLAAHVDGCPRPARVWRGKPYANVADDCTGCEHALEISGERVICDG